MCHPVKLCTLFRHARTHAYVLVCACVYGNVQTRFLETSLFPPFFYSAWIIHNWIESLTQQEIRNQWILFRELRSKKEEKTPKISSVKERLGRENVLLSFFAFSSSLSPAPPAVPLLLTGRERSSGRAVILAIFEREIIFPRRRESHISIRVGLPHVLR